MINYPNLQQIFNQQMDHFLSSNGLSTPCVLTWSSSSTQECPNCLYDSILKQSSSAYKTGGPKPFSNGQLCPYCRGSGQAATAQSVTIPMAVLWDYKSWIIKPVNIDNPVGLAQTICHKQYLNSILQAQDMTVLNGDPNPPTFILDGEPTPAGLGDNNYIISQWKKIRK